MYQESTLWSNLQINAWRLQVLKALEIQAFIDWLTTKNPDEVVGMAYRIEKCPLSYYLSDRLPHLDCCVGRSQITTQMPNGSFCNGSRDLIYLRSGDDLPDWVTKFVDAIDDICMRKTPIYHKWEKGEIGGMLSDYEFPVLAHQALFVVKQI